MDQPAPTGSAAPAQEGQQQQNSNTANNLNGGGDGGGALNRPRVPRQRTMASYLLRQLRPDEKKKIDKYLLKMITMDFQPFSIVEDKGFREFVEAINPVYELPSRKTLANSLLGVSLIMSKYVFR